MGSGAGGGQRKEGRAKERKRNRAESSSESSSSESSDDGAARRRRRSRKAAAAPAAASATTAPSPAPSAAADPPLAATDAAAASVRALRARSACREARADALMVKLTAKLDRTTDPRKRIALQAKQLRLLPLCTPPLPAARPPAPPKQQQQLQQRQAAAPQLARQRTPHAAPPLATAMPRGPAEEARRRLRQARFGDATVAGGEEDEEEQVLAARGGYGTSEALEKEYLRLTSLPLASAVRPPHVLAVALKRVKAKWLQRPDYTAAAEQLKAIRQDLTVQHVRDALTVDVYETHGRLALEADDLSEFRRCHGVLRQLYGEGVPGNAPEFEAYGLLYTQATPAARSTLAMELCRVPEQLLRHPYVQHALDVCCAFRSGNYARFMALYDGAPRMSPYIMDRMLEQVRLVALAATVAACKPLPVPLAQLAEALGVEGEEEAAAFADKHGAAVDRREGCLDTRASAGRQLGPPRPPPGPEA